MSILVENSFDVTFVNSILTFDIELLAVTISKSQSNVLGGYIHLIVCVYRPPSGSASEFTVMLNNFLSCCPKSHYVTILGDFNRYDTTEIELCHGLIHRVKFNTRVNATLDQILSNVHHYSMPERIEPIGTSDHVSIGFFPQSKSCKPIKRKVFIPDKRHRYIAEADISLFNADWGQICTSNNVEIAQMQLQRVIQDALSKIPMRSVILTNRDPPWMNSIIKDLENRRTGAFKKNDLTLVDNLTHVLNHEIVKAKKRQVAKLSHSSRDWWRSVNKSLKNDAKCLSSFTSQYSSDMEAASQLNQVLVERFVESSPLSFPPTVSPESRAPEITLHQVILGLRSLRNRSASGPDCIPVWFLKTFESHIAKPLTAVFNLSLSTGVFPTEWKKAVISPLPKVSKPTTPNDFRPISLTSVLSKLFERIVLKMISPLWRSVMNTDQYAYRPLSSTVCALTAIQHHWLSTLDTNAKCYIKVFAVDFSKAFDSIEHSLLIGKLISYGFDDWFVVWLYSFLTGRTQHVKINCTLSPSLPVTRGIPQGTVIGPFTFVIFTNDLRPQDEERMSVIKYADDQSWSYLIPHDKQDHSDAELKSIASWCKLNQMMINERKTCEMVISNEGKRKTLSRSFINGVLLERVDSVKVLGLVLSNDLKWSKEIESRTTKCNKLAYAMKHLSYTYNSRDMLRLFTAVFVPTLSYCNPVLCNMSMNLLNQLQQICNKVSRYTGKHFDVKNHMLNCTLRLFEDAFDPAHPLHNIVAPHISTARRSSLRRRRLLSVRATTARFHDSFLPLSIRMFNNK